jgi:probable rRNA maturation factor
MVIVEQSKLGISAQALERFLRKAQRSVRLRGEVGVLVASNARIRRLNRQFRGKDKPTDVLSFPAASQNGLAGDIAISAAVARKNARALGHSLLQEIQVLVLHGLLHLAGYDHEIDNGRMARRERLLRKRLGLPDSLIERSSSGAQTGTKSKRKLRRATITGTPAAAGRRRRSK